MSWKGTLRTIQATQRQAEREAKRRQRELQQQQAAFEQMHGLERAKYEVQVYENYLDVLLSIHKECGDFWDWQLIRTSPPPTKPIKSNSLEQLAQSELENFKPAPLDRLLKRAETKEKQLLVAVDKAKQADETNYQQALEEYQRELQEWEELTHLADRILAKEPNAYIQAIQEIDPFSEINLIGSSIEFEFDGDVLDVTLRANSDEVIPAESKTLLKSGAVSVKKISKSNFYALYQDYVCSAVLRIARELFALLPIEIILVTATGHLLNTQTGYMEEQPILSVIIPKKTLSTLNLDMIDPSDSMTNFIHRMNFVKTKGFTAIKRISVEELPSK